jgi:hypothetical protein
MTMSTVQCSDMVQYSRWKMGQKATCLGKSSLYVVKSTVRISISNSLGWET